MKLEKQQAPAAELIAAQLVPVLLVGMGGNRLGKMECAQFAVCLVLQFYSF